MVNASELLQTWVNAIKNGDPKQVTSLYHQDGILLGTFSAAERVGHELILEYFENLLKNPVEVDVISEHPHDFEDSESSAVNSGLYNFVTGGKTINARFSFVYDADGKIVSHHSSILPET
jgi:uncharacterized protein (TIGR02246 family)